MQISECQVVLLIEYPQFLPLGGIKIYILEVFSDPVKDYFFSLLFFITFFPYHIHIQILPYYFTDHVWLFRLSLEKY